MGQEYNEKMSLVQVPSILLDALVCKFPAQMQPIQYDWAQTNQVDSRSDSSGLCRGGQE
jgi:hypothetical protein